MIMKQGSEVYWLKQTQADVPSDDAWLTLDERARLSCMQIPKRRNDWRLGRWTAKSAVAAYFHWPFERMSDIEILAVPSGAPKVVIRDLMTPPNISITHRGTMGMCALGPPAIALGCDLELLEPRTEAFINDYFTPGERAVLHQFSVADHPLIANLFWSAKESALKAFGEGLRVDTTLVEVDLVLPEIMASSQVDIGSLQDWLPLWVGYLEQQMVGWWQLNRNVIQTVVGSSLKPVCLPQARFEGDEVTATTPVRC